MLWALRLDILRRVLHHTQWLLVELLPRWISRPLSPSLNSHGNARYRQSLERLLHLYCLVSPWLRRLLVKEVLVHTSNLTVIFVELKVRTSWFVKSTGRFDRLIRYVLTAAQVFSYINLFQALLLVLDLLLLQSVFLHCPICIDTDRGHVGDLFVFFNQIGHATAVALYLLLTCFLQDIKDALLIF